eukprot:496572_1
MIQETKLFMAKIIKQCLDQLDVNNLDMELIKDTFQYTINWCYPSLQKLVLSAIPDNQYEMLLNRDNILFANNKHVMHQIIETDNLETCKIILPNVTNEKQLVPHVGQHNILNFAIQNGVGYKCIKTILDSFANKKEILALLTENNNESFTNVYKKGDKHYANLLLSYLDDKQKNIALHAALPHDKLFIWIPSILQTLTSSKQLKCKLLHSTDCDGFTLLRRAGHCDFRYVSEWLVEEIITETDDPMLLQSDNIVNAIPLFVGGMKEYYNYVMLTLNKLSSKNKLKALTIMKDYSQKNFLDHCNQIWCRDTTNVMLKCMETTLKTMDDITDITNDFDIIFPLFKYLTTCIEADRNINLIDFILSKTQKFMKKKLFMNYENDRNWNVFIKCTDTEKQKSIDKEKLFSYLIKTIKNEDIVGILNDSENVNYQNQRGVIHQLCVNGTDLHTVKMILSVYDDNKENSDQQLIKKDYNNKTPLFHLFETAKHDLIAFILNRIKSDSTKMMIFNQETRDKHQNIFDVVTNSSKCK